MMRKFGLLLCLTLYFGINANTQGFLVDRHADAVGFSYARSSSSNILGLMYSYSFRGKVDAGIGVSRQFTSPSFSNYSLAGYGDYYFVKQKEGLPVTFSGGMGFFYHKFSSYNSTTISPNITGYHKIELENSIIQPFVNLSYDHTSSSGVSNGTTFLGLGANIALPGKKDNLFVLTPNIKIGGSTTTYGIAFLCILPSKNGGGKSEDVSMVGMNEELKPKVEPDETTTYNEVEELEDKKTDASKQEDAIDEKPETLDRISESEIVIDEKNVDLIQSTNETTIEKALPEETQKDNEGVDLARVEMPKGEMTKGGKTTTEEEIRESSENEDKASEQEVNLPVAAASEERTYFVQIGALLKAPESMEIFKDALIAGSLFKIETLAWTRIRVGKFKDEEQAETAKNMLIAHGYKDAFILEDSDQEGYEQIEFE